MRLPWRRNQRTSLRALAAQDKADEALDRAKRQAPRVDQVIWVARALARQADALAGDVERVLRRL